MSSTFTARVLNLLIGLCRGAPGLPNPLRALGYRDLWLADGLPECGDDRLYALPALASAKMQHTLFVEIADGPRLNAARFSGYERTTTADLIAKTPLTRDQLRSWGVAVAGRAEHRDTLRASMAGIGCRPTLLLCDAAGVTIAEDPFPQGALTGIFRPGLRVDREAFSRCWIAFAHDSPAIFVIEAVLPEIVGRFLHGATRIEILRLAQGHVLWQLATARGRRRLEARIREVLADTAAREMRPWFRVRGDEVEAVGGTDSGKALPRNQRRLWRLAKAQTRLLQRLRREEEEEEAPHLFMGMGL